MGTSLSVAIVDWLLGATLPVSFYHVKQSLGLC